MSRAIRAHNLGAMTAMVLLVAMLIVLVTLALAMRSAPTASDRESSPDGHAMSGTGGMTIAQDPNIERHVEVVQRLGNGRLY